jgi:hypothetical protein
MKMNIRKTSDWDYKEEKEFKYLTDLLDFTREQGPCILFPPNVAHDYWVLEIYDDYRE